MSQSCRGRRFRPGEPIELDPAFAKMYARERDERIYFEGAYQPPRYVHQTPHGTIVIPPGAQLELPPVQPGRVRWIPEPSFAARRLTLFIAAAVGATLGFIAGILV